MMNISADFVNGAITGILARFEDECGRIRIFYCEEIENEVEEETCVTEFSLQNEVRMMLDGLNIQNVVELVWVDDNPAVTSYALCISYILDGKLYVYNEAVYN